VADGTDAGPGRSTSVPTSNDTITSVDLAHRPFRLTADSGTVYTSDAVIVATGAEAKVAAFALGAEVRGYGVSASPRGCLRRLQGHPARGAVSQVAHAETP